MECIKYLLSYKPTINIKYKENKAFYENDFKKALSYYLKSLDYRSKIGNNDLLSTSYINIGEAYMKLNDFIKADKFLADALKLSEQTGNKDDQMVTYQVMSELYKVQGNFEISDCDCYVV